MKTDRKNIKITHFEKTALIESKNILVSATHWNGVVVIVRVVSSAICTFIRLTTIATCSKLQLHHSGCTRECTCCSFQ